MFLQNVAASQGFSMLWLSNGNNKQAAGLFPRFLECNCTDIIFNEWLVDYKRKKDVIHFYNSKI